MSDLLFEESMPQLRPEVNESFRVWREAGLGEPVIPARFAPDIKAYGEWQWGT